jgi:Spy/CpxP family protein refolding chaperone
MFTTFFSLYLDMKKTLILVAWASLAAAGARAQTTPAMQAAVNSQTQRISQELGLAPDQQGRLRQVLLQTRQHMDADRAAHQDDPAALQTAMAFDRAKSDELIRAILTPAQYVRYQQNKAARIGQLHTTSQVGR